jgi:hypothetical protein
MVSGQNMLRHNDLKPSRHVFMAVCEPSAEGPGPKGRGLFACLQAAVPDFHPKISGFLHLSVNFSGRI